MFINVTATIIMLPTKLAHLLLSCFPRFHGYNIWMCGSIPIRIHYPALLLCTWGKQKCLSGSLVFTFTARFVLQYTNIFQGGLFFTSSYHHQPCSKVWHSPWNSLLWEWWCVFGVWAVWGRSVKQACWITLPLMQVECHSCKNYCTSAESLSLSRARAHARCHTR